MDPERYETLLVHGRLGAGEESMAELAEREGARMRYVPAFGPELRAEADARALRAVAGIIREFRPDLVHTHTAKAGFVGRVAALARRGPRPVLVHTFHGHVLEGYFGPAKTRLFRALERGLGRRSDCLIGVSEATVDDLVRLGVAPRERFEVVPLGLDLAAYARLAAADGLATRRHLGLGEDDALAVFVGRLAPVKRVDVLLRALATARARAPQLRLAIVGDGELRGELEALARKVGVADVTLFLGYRRDLAPILAAADLAVVSSDNEGTPVSLIEAGAAGLPAVATDVGGVSEVVTPESGVLVPPGDESRLGEALARLAQDAALRRSLGAAARRHTVERYSVERLVADIDRLYQSLAGRA